MTNLQIALCLCLWTACLNSAIKNRCYNVLYTQPNKCPVANNTFIRCWSQSLRLGASGGFGAQDTFVNDSLVVMPSTKVYCTITCRNQQNGAPAAEECNPLYFSNGEQGKTRGDLSEFQPGSAEHTVVFFYQAPNYSEDLVDGGSDSFKININGNEPIKNAETTKIMFPRRPSVRTGFVCNARYTKMQDVVSCSILPKDDAGQRIAGAPMMFAVTLAEDADEEIGSFPARTFLTADVDGMRLAFQYQAGNKPGVNTIQAKFSDDLPSALPRNKLLSPGILTIRTVPLQRPLQNSYAVFSLPVVFFAIFQCLTVLK